MALNWDLTKIENHETLCWVGDGDDARMNPVTEALIFLSIPIGVPMITAENLAETWTRISMWQDVQGAPLAGPGGIDQFLIPEDIRAHIGLKTNASALTVTKFNSNLIKALREHAKHRFAKASV